jgi:hypothetical protein
VLQQIGQATVITHWVYEDGSEGGPAASEPIEPTERPTDEEIRKAGAHHQHAVLSVPCSPMLRNHSCLPEDCDVIAK